MLHNRKNVNHPTYLVRISIQQNDNHKTEIYDTYQMEKIRNTTSEQSIYHSQFT